MLKISIICLCIAFSFGLFAAEVEEYIQQGDKLYEKFDNVAALKYYNKAYEEAPNNFEVLLKITRTYNDAGEQFKEMRQRDKAEPYIRKGLKYAQEFQKKFPDSAQAYAYLALSYGNLAMYLGDKEKIKFAKKIEENAKKSIKMNPNDFLPYIVLGIYYRELASLSWLERFFANTFFGDVPDGTYEDSERMFKKALQLRPDMVIALYQLSKTYRELDRENDERKLLNKLLSLKNENFRDVFAKEKAKRRLEDLS